MEKKILLIDDEQDITNLIEVVLKKEGFNEIKKAHSGADGIELCKQYRPDVVVLDVMLPDIDGLEVCKIIRTFSYCSILFLSAKSDDIDKILGLASGGDDYITKPFSPKEVVFRIKAQLRRQQYQTISHETSQQIYRVNDLKVDLEAGRAYKGEKELELTGREFLMLAYFIQNVNHIISKERLYEQVWGEYSSICDNTIMVHIRHLREKIEENPSNPQILITVKGLGYKLRKRDD
ncbi:MAG: response regulator transcription factor [Cellulosilyticum sp.]|nr:response regulator transcription factor [Cellulosilyticum sp.]